MQGFRGLVERWGGRGSRGGASELLGGARGGRSQWLRRTAATVCFGRERERAREKPGESERERGRGVASSRPSRRGEEARQAGEQVAWRGGARARRPHSPPSVGTKTTEEGGGRGRGRVRESRGEAWRRPGHRARRGGQAGRRAGGVARWRARVPATLPSLCRGRRRQRREAGWAGQLAGPEAPGKRPR